MQNRSNIADLPAFFAPSVLFSPDRTVYKTQISVLPIFDFTYLHFHDNLEIGYCVEGEGICAVDGREYPFKKGDAQIILPYQKHLSKNTGSSKSRWFWINVEPSTIMERFGWQTAAVAENILHNEIGVYGIFSKEEYPRLNEAVERLFYETGHERKPHDSELSAIYIFEILIELSRLSEGLPKVEVYGNSGIIRLLSALDMIKMGVATGNIPSVVALARECCQSEANFRRIFTKEIGVSPKEYVSQCRIRKAQNLLFETDKSILEISGECGFENISGFNRRFFSETGLTPSEYRRHFKKTKQ